MTSRVRLGLVVTVLVAAVLAFPTVAAAAGTVTWSQLTPAPGSTTYSSRPTIMVRAVDTEPIWQAFDLKIDGQWVNTTRTFDKIRWRVYDYSKCTLTAIPTWDLAPGTHTVEAYVYDGLDHKTTWTFTVAVVPPSIGPISPATGTLVSTTTPQISATVGGTVISSVSVKIDGAVVSSTLANGVVTAMPTVSNENTHNVEIRAYAANGTTAVATSNFFVLKKMSGTPVCVDCHPGYPGIHPVDDCSACHGVGAPLEGSGSDNPEDSHAPGTGCANCHQVWDACGVCHADAYVTVPRLHTFARDEFHVLPESGCGGPSCHSGRITVVHDTEGLTCTLCHGAAATPSAAAAIAAGVTGCGDCHAGGAHLTQHASTLPDNCLTCHEANLVAVHTTARTYTCDTCHKSTQPAVVAAIAANDRSCVACHGAAASDHGPMHDTAVAAECAECHVANLITEHAVRGVECVGCHGAADSTVADAIEAGDKACSACHSLSGHPYLTPQHTATIANVMLSGTMIDSATGLPYVFPDYEPMTYEQQACGSCHLMDLLAEHTKPSSSVRAASCAACHATPRSTFVNWNQTCQQGGCHASYHGDMQTKHAWSYVGRDASCGYGYTNCHGLQWPRDLAALHNGGWWYYQGEPTASGRNWCGACHTSPSTVPFTATSCLSCHSLH